MQLAKWFVVLVLTSVSVRAASVSIAWDPPIPSDNVAGYKIYWGQGSRDYTGNVDAGNVCSGKVPDLDQSKTYYFALTAYNSSSNESDFSAELVWDNTAPTLTAPAKIKVEIEAGASMTLPDYRSLVTVTDDFSTGLVVVQTPAAGSPLVPGMSIEFSATDEAGNTGRVTRVVTVAIIITQPPVAPRGEDENGRSLQTNEGAE